MARLTEKHRRNTENLRPWKPGQSGNPRGRPPNPLSITHVLRELGETNDAEKIRKLAETLWTLAIDERELPAIREVLDRLEGKVTERVRMETISNAEAAAAAMTPEDRLAELKRLQEQYEAMTREESHDTSD